VRGKDERGKRVSVREEALSDLSQGTRAVVAHVDDDGPVGRRLLDLGLLPGTPLKVVRIAPLGDPGVYELRGYQLCLRRSESSRVSVRVANGADGAEDDGGAA
jgi:ferrous iron transport protein A